MSRGADGVVFHGQVVADAPHYDFAGMETHPHLRLDPVVAANIDGLADHGILHGKRRVAGTDRVILMSDRPLYRWVRGVGFVDAGNIFASDEPVRLRDLRLGYGFGLRVDSLVGLFRVDFGIPGSALNGVASSRQPNSLKGGRWYFGLGHIF